MSFRNRAYRLYDIYKFDRHLEQVSPYHYYPRRTEAALATIALCYAFLCWMWVFDIANTLYRYDMLTINADQRSQAGIDRGMVDLLCCRVEL